MGPRGLDADVADPQAGDLGDAQATAAGEADENEIEPGVRGSRGLAVQVGQDGGQLAPGENLRGVDDDRAGELHGAGSGGCDAVVLGSGSQLPRGRWELKGRTDAVC